METPKYLKTIYLLNFAFLVAYTSLNILGMPELKYLFLAYSVTILAAVIHFPFSQILFLIISLLFIEGQGRILFEYHPVARVIFDVALSLAILKQFITQRKLLNVSLLPTYFTVLFVVHTLWYFFEIFNIFNVGFTAPIAASKVYIFPFLLFFFFINENFDIKSEAFKRLIQTLLFLFILEFVISMVQLAEKETLMLQISQYYRMPMKENVFVGIKFRPFGTTHLPGGISTYLYLSFCFLFFQKPEKNWQKWLFWLVILAGGVTILSTQVRSAFIKYSALLVVILGISFLFGKNKFRNFAATLAVVLTFTITLATTSLGTKVSELLHLQESLNRIETLKNEQTIKNTRIDFATFYSIVSEKLSTNPFGLGPGLTGATQSLSKDAIENDPILHPGLLWAYDNLIISLVIDFGYGAVFYLLFLAGLPCFILIQAIKALMNKNFELLKIKLVCAGVIIIILAGNWGAVGLTYNPESFFFWLWAAIGITYRGPEVVTT